MKNSLIKYYYPTNSHDGLQQHFALHDQYKTIQFYQNVLQQEGSIIIKSIHDQFTTERRLLYHKIEIVKFTSLRNWGTFPFILKPLQGHLIKYSYYNYIDAWFKIFLHQNDNISHSWFIAWHEKYNFTKTECQPPMWFIKWWSKHDSQTEIIPDTLWVTKPPIHPNDPPMSTHTLREALLHFTKLYKCTEYNSNSLIRSFAVKWFDKYNKDRIIHFVYDEFPSEVVKELEDKPSSSTSIQDMLKVNLLKSLQIFAKWLQSNASGKHSPASSEGSINAKETTKFPYAPVSMPSNWYQDSLFQDSHMMGMRLKI